MNTSPTTQMSTTPTIARVSKAVYTIIERPGKQAFWLRIGWCHVNRDGSFNINLDAFPVNGKLQVRDWQPREDRERNDAEGSREQPFV